MQADLMASSDYPTALHITLAVRAGTHREIQARGHHRQCHRELQNTNCASLLLYHNSLDKGLQRLQVHQGGGLDFHIEGLLGAPVILNVGLQGSHR